MAVYREKYLLLLEIFRTLLLTCDAKQPLLNVDVRVVVSYNNLYNEDSFSTGAVADFLTREDISAAKRCCLFCAAWKYVLSLVDYKGKTDAELFTNITQMILNGGNKDSPEATDCFVNYIPIEFDLSNVTTVRNSLYEARKRFDQSSEISVAIGPFIDHFTSPKYVITRQVHVLTTSSATVRKNVSKDRIMSLVPDPNKFAEAVANVIKQLGWNNVVFLSDDDFSPVLTLTEQNILVTPILLPTDRHLEIKQVKIQLKKILLSLRRFEWQNFVLHTMNRRIITDVLKEAKELWLLYEGLQWFVTYLDFKDITENGPEVIPENVYGLQLLHVNRIPENLLAMYNTSQSNITRLYLGLLVDIVGIILTTAELTPDNCSRKENIVDAQSFTKTVKEMNSPYNGSLGTYEWSDKLRYTRINYTINITRGHERIGSVTLLEQGQIVNLTNQHQAVSNTPFGKEQDFSVVAKMGIPYVVRDEKENIYKGFAVDVCNKIAEQLKFKCQIYTLNDDEETGDIGPLVKELMTGNASMAIGAIPIKSSTEEEISMSYTIVCSKVSMLIKGTGSQTGLFQFLTPFSLELWITIVASLFAVTLALYLMSRFDQTQEASEQKFDLKESLWYSINVFLGGETEYSPQTTSTRTIIAFYWFSILIITAAYTANLAAIFTLEQYDNSIKSIYELAKQTKIKYGVLKNSHVQRFFEDNSSYPYDRMWTAMKINEDDLIVPDMDTAIEKVTDGSYVFLNDALTNDHYASAISEIQSIHQEFGMNNYGFAFPKGAPYRDDINKEILKMKENRFIEKLKKRWFGSIAECQEKDPGKQETKLSAAKLSLQKMVGLFIIFGICAALAIVVEITRQIRLCCEKRALCKCLQKHPPKGIVRSVKLCSNSISEKCV